MKKKILFTGILVLFLSTLQAQYEWDKWDFSRTEFSSGWVQPWPFPPDGGVWLAAAGPINSTKGYVQYEVTLKHSGVFSFDWQAFSNNPDISPAAVEVYYADTIFNLFDVNGNPNYQKSTHVTPFLCKGTKLGFRVHSWYDSTIDRVHEAQLILTKFTNPTTTAACGNSNGNGNGNGIGNGSGYNGNGNGLTNGRCKVEIYPNPSSGQIRINLSCFNGLRKIEVYNMAGKLVSKAETNQTSYALNLTGAKGMYLIKVNGELHRVIKN